MEEKKLYNAVRKIITLADGRQIEIETGKLAKQADGSVVVKMGDTMLLGTVVAAKDAKPDTDFMPLQVEYKEKYAAVGRFPGGFMKREARANDSEVLVARLIDRALRPLFPADYHAEVYVTVNLISADKDIQPDALAGLAASAALAVSDIPFGGPISEVRVVRRNGEYAINPTYSEMPECDLDIMVGGTIDNILMVEGEMKEVSEEVMLGAIKFAHEEIKKHCAVQIELSKELGKDVKRTYCHEVNDEELRQTIIRELYDKAYAIATSGTMKHEREDKFNALEAEFAARYSEEELIEKAPLIHKYFHDDVQKKAMRNMILDEGVRLDGRKTDEIRPIWCEVGYLPAAHGSAIFTRGETQYSLRLLPIGGYCAMEGEDEKSDDPHAFGNRPVWQRMIVVAAGGIMNILLAVLLMMVICGQEDRYATMRIAGFAENSAFEAAGVEVGDVITSIDGYTVRTGQDLSFALSMAALDSTDGTAALDLTVKRGEETVTFNDMTINTTSTDGKQYRAVLDFYVLGEEKTPWTLIKNAFADTYSTVRMIFNSLIGMVTGRFGFSGLAGPVGTAQAVTQAASAGLKQSFGAAVNNIVYIMLVISVNLGIVNLLPLPALDGGRLVFLIIEAIFRRPVPAKYERWVHAGGFALLICLVLAVTFQDIMRIATGG